MVAFFRSQAIFRPGLPGMPHCHAATLVQTGTGNLLAAWFGGTRQGHPDVGIWLARCEAQQWSPPVRVARVPGIPLWNPVLFRDRSDTIWLWYKAGPAVAAWTGVYIRSIDDGNTWSAPVFLPAGLLGPSKNKPIILSNGDILCGTSAETWNSWSCWLERSCDAGVTWQKHGPISAPAAFAGRPFAGASQVVQPDNFAGVIQPAIWEYAPGRLKMLMRATRRVGRICQSSSDDMGYSWSPAQRTELENPNSGLDAVRLADGRVVIVYNPSQSDRSPLAIALSEDNGVTWPYRRLLETEAGEFSYPAIIQDANGFLHVTYSCWRNHIQHVTLEPDWIRATR
jgi:predicted neuraminidase